MSGMTIEQAFQLALAHHQAGRLAEAEAIYRQILTVQPNHANTLHLLGQIALTTGHYEDAVRLISAAITHSPSQAYYHGDLGVACRQLGRLEEAIASYQNALSLEPKLSFIHLNLGDALHAFGKLEEAIASFRRALEIQPDYPEALNNLGNVLAAKGRHDEAIPCYQRALALKPGYAEAENNFASSLLEAGNIEGVFAASHRALALNPGLHEAHGNMAAACLRTGDYNGAIQSYRRAIACHANFATGHWNLALLLLLLGHHEEGWKEYEWRWRHSGFANQLRNFPVPQWDGSRIPTKTILLHAEQGFGDTIQFLRYVPLVQRCADARHVIVECPVELERLLKQNGSLNAQVIPKQSAGAVAPPQFDYHLPLLSLPWALRMFAPDHPALPQVHYLNADAELRTLWHARLHPAVGLRVGIAWAGRLSNPNDHLRSISVEGLLPLLQIPGVSCYSLQLAPSPEQTAVFREAGGNDLTEHIADFADTAALIANLDLVITVDTAAAHLAGAIGKPVWTLLPFVPDWRWGLQGGKSPWYPTMRLFRQPKAGDWDSVIFRVAEELAVFRN
jgi:tetratricopeptide (TPR) repeat protein